MNSLIMLWIENWRILRLYFYSKERIYARNMALLLIIMELLSVGLEVVFTYWQKMFMNTFPTFNQTGFLRSIIYFCFFLIGMTVVTVYKQYWAQLLQIRWRRWLTDDFLQKYLSGNVYYKIALLKNYDSTINDQNDNPDQRISMDINTYIENTCKLVLNGLHSGVALISNLIVLWSLSGVIKINVTEHWTLHIYGMMVWIALIYASLGRKKNKFSSANFNKKQFFFSGTLITNWIGRALFNLQYAQEHYEANFRYGLVHLRDHTESVALYKSEANEHKFLSSLYLDLMMNFYKFVRRKFILDWFTSLYNLAAHVVPFLVASPRYFSKAIAFGDLIQTSTTFANVHKSLSFIPDSYEAIVSWRSATKRLIHFLNTLDDFHTTTQTTSINLIHIPGKQCIHIQELVIQLPQRTGEDRQQILINNLDLILQSYQSVLITGKKKSKLVSESINMLFLLIKVKVAVENQHFFELSLVFGRMGMAQSLFH